MIGWYMSDELASGFLDSPGYGGVIPADTPTASIYHYLSWRLDRTALTSMMHFLLPARACALSVSGEVVFLLNIWFSLHRFV